MAILSIHLACVLNWNEKINQVATFFKNMFHIMIYGLSLPVYLCKIYFGGLFYLV